MNHSKVCPHARVLMQGHWTKGCYMQYPQYLLKQVEYQHSAPSIFQDQKKVLSLKIFSFFPVFSTQLNQTSFFFLHSFQHPKIFFHQRQSKNVFPPLMEKYFWIQKCFSTSDGKIFLDPKIFFHQTYLSDVLTLATFYYINQVQVRLMEKYFWIQKYFSVRRALKMLKI